MALFGVPPEEFWKYNLAEYDVEPTAFCYAGGQLRFLIPVQGIELQEGIKRVVTNGNCKNAKTKGALLI